MKTIDSLLLDLKSSDSRVRDDAALELMDLGNEVAIIPLLNAIARPENADHRGTLVYALSVFDCLEHLEVLVDLALTGNYEVSTVAFNIIDETALSDEAVQRVSLQLSKYNRHQLPFTHSSESYESLSQLVSGNGA